MAGGVSRLACSTIRKGITFPHFPPAERKQRARWKCVCEWKLSFPFSLSLFFDECVSDWSWRKKRLFCAPPVNTSFGRQARFAGGEHQNKRTTDNKYRPQKASAKCLFCPFHRLVNRKCCCVGRRCSHTADSTGRHRRKENSQRTKRTTLLSNAQL